MNMVIENVRQLRGEVDDYCPNWQQGEHSYDYSEGGCRALKDPLHTMNLGWAQPATASALIMTTTSSRVMKKSKRGRLGSSVGPISYLARRAKSTQVRQTAPLSAPC